MKYVVDVAGERITIGIDGTEVTVGDEQLNATLNATLDRVPSTPVRLLRIGNRVHRLMVRRSASGHGDSRGSYTVDIDGERVELVALDERTRAIRDLTRASSGPVGPAPLVAPMPGLVVRVAVAVGERVSAGQGLVVIEAMKMENELRASADGVVTAVKVTAGVAVDKGALLVELAAVEA